jgi:L,D-transpeptidase catalytic domain/Putative peptidoglycan binding domain
MFLTLDRGKHRASTRWLQIAALVLVVLLVGGAAGTAFAAYRSERARWGRILPGVVIQGVPVGGMTQGQAVRAVTAAIQPILSRPITVRAKGHVWTTSARSFGLEADVQAAVDAALAFSQAHSTVSRLIGRLEGRTYPLLIGLSYSVSDSIIGRFVGEIERAVTRRARNAGLFLEGGAVVGVHSRRGAALDPGTEQLLRTQLLRGSTSPRPSPPGTLSLHVGVINPKVDERSLGRTIAVDLTTNRLFLYDGLSVIRSYPVATAKPGFLTPPGVWKVVDKQMFPTWYNPAPDGWAANEPLVVPPGPDNPMGTRALYLDAPGLIRIHGTNTPSSIGHYASHGCIRLHIPDIEALYPLVPVGSKVLIYGAPPWGIPTMYGISGA